MIGRALRTILGAPLIALAVIPAGLLIGLFGESQASERLLRAWCRLVLFCAGAREVLAPKGFSLFRPGLIAVVFGPPIPIAGHTLEDRARLVAQQRTAVEACVREARALLAKAGSPETV